MRAVILAGLAVLLAGCTTAPQQTEEPKLWGRVDCRRGAEDPEVQRDYEQAQAICLPRAEAAAVAGTTAIPVGYGMGGAIASGIQRGMAQNQIASATIMSCMAERGYLLRTRAEHESACQAVAAAKPPARRAAAQ